MVTFNTAKLQISSATLQKFWHYQMVHGGEAHRNYIPSETFVTGVPTFYRCYRNMGNLLLSFYK